ncbi:flagellar hook-length control protein FliK [Paenibacillus sp. YPG26]|uniref:flagellar hook-length control protein FliK n=1 Tax=Paenibacillus sp. YPG26 TaxID=2878915 RepID=UPI00203D3CBD|nr:flagellar hook-length control protein FliK [Paenibacillus sp. YPG26]USB32094.1 flagellar hook-length control protein FliK [Paenibacillus sp. YPG26]
MSLIMNSSAGNVASAISAGPSGKAAQMTNPQAAQGTAPAFNQTLVQLLLNTLGGQAVPAQGASSSSQPSLAGNGTQPAIDQAAVDSAETQAPTALGDLLKDVNALDDAIAADPALVAVLQNWLQQVQVFLNQGQAAAGNETNQSAEGLSQELPLIAQHAETIRFAVQDGVQQLLSKLEAQPSQAAQNLPQVAQLLQSLQTAMTPVSDSVKQFSEQIDGQMPVSAGQEGGAKAGLLRDLLGLAGIHTNGQVKTEHRTQTASTVVALPTKDQPALRDGMISTSGISQSSEAADEGTGKDVTVKPADSSLIVTAGQLQIRDSGLVPAKPLQTAVHVEQFAKEMSGFVVGKLDIVKLQGMTEATISLFPEHLGQVDVKITMQNGHLIAQFATEHAFAKDSLEQQMNQLRAALQSQGIQVERLEVTQNTSLSSHMYHDGRQPGSGAGQGEQKRNGRQRELGNEDAVAAADMTEEWNEWIREVRSKEEDFGSSFVARA